MAARAEASPAPPVAETRPGGEVMRLSRLGASHPHRLSFARALIRRMNAQDWRISLDALDLDAAGHGHIAYRIETPEGPLGFAAFTQAIPDAARTDRVIAEVWDAAFALSHGAVGADDLARLAANAPRQEAGRMSAREIVLSRANKSVRLFSHVVERLAAGRQPDMAEILKVGYLMRTTAVYGNGKFGLADYDKVVGDGIFRLPYQAEMLTVYLARQLSIDLVEHVARARGGASAVRLDRRIARFLGVGNATGLGMAPYLVTHPKLIHAWFAARETALARARASGPLDAPAEARLLALIARARAHVAEWLTDDARQTARIAELAADLEALVAAAPALLTGAAPLEALIAWARPRGLETQELVASLAIEARGDMSDDLPETMAADERAALDPTMRLGALKALVERDYAWALAIPFDAPETEHYFWYVSEEKEEPRIGLRDAEPGAERELPLDVARAVHRLHAALSAAAPDAPLAELMLARPDLRGIARRVQSLAGLDYAEIRDNILGADCRPIDMLRAKLAMFGATKFDPKSDRWTRIALFQGAPLPDELDAVDADDWAFPTAPPQPLA